MEEASTPEITEGKEKGPQTQEEYVMPSKPILIILVGLIGSGKVKTSPFFATARLNKLQSTFAKAVERHFPRFRRCNQDELGNRKKVERLVVKTLSEGHSVIVDRTNIDAR
jgi:hypothetical protein